MPLAAAGKSAQLPEPPAVQVAPAAAPALIQPPAAPKMLASALIAPVVAAPPVVMDATPAQNAPPLAAQQPAYALGSPGGTGRPNPPLPAPAGRDLGVDFPVDGPRILVGFLVSFDNVEVGQYWPIHQGRNVLGRQGAATGLDIEVSHPTTSSLHAVLLATARPGRVVVEDTSSTNGTFVNDNLLAPGHRWELRDGDRLRFGLFDTVIKILQKT